MARTPPVKAPVIAPGIAPVMNYPTLRGPKVVKAVDDIIAKRALIKALEVEVKMTRDYLIGEMKGAPVAFVGGHQLTLTDVPARAAVPSRVITKDMVGSAIPAKPGQAGYQKLDVA